MITTISLVNMLPYIIFFLWWEKIFYVNNFQICNTILLIIATMVFITSPWLLYFITRSLYLLTPFTHFTHLPLPTSLETTILLSVWIGFWWSFCLFAFKIPHIHEIIQYLSFSVWIVSLSIIPSGPFILPQMVRFHPFYEWIIFHCIYYYFFNG